MIKTYCNFTGRLLMSITNYKSTYIFQVEYSGNPETIDSASMAGLVIASLHAVEPYQSADIENLPGSSVSSAVGSGDNDVNINRLVSS